MEIFENWVELDLNPVLSFSSTGKILYTNQEAQFLLNKIQPKELYELAVRHAPASYGFKTTYLDLKMKNYIFYAMTVGYENEDEIHVKLYKSTMVKKEKKSSNKNEVMTNIFTLVDLAISSKKSQSEIQYLKNYDPSIPEFKLVVQDFLKLLNTIYDSIENASVITTSVKLKTGEYMRIDEVKYSLICVEIHCDGLFYNFNENSDANSSFILTVHSDKILIDLPLLLK